MFCDANGLNEHDRLTKLLHFVAVYIIRVELVEVGEISDANQALYDIITDNQTRRRQWSKTYEGIMMKLMELSVELRQPGMVKEALHKYRAMCMQSNVASLEEVVRFLVDLAEKRTEAARKLVDETILEGAEDLEDGAMETPETLLLESAGNALTKERIDRQQVVPWMRFLWEVYRVVLDIVKTHNKLELCYHGMATRAFSFCIKYKRFMEFRRLCDMLRQHLSQLMNNPRVSPNDVKITDAETLQKFMETRFTQLSTAVTLEHWQQAYRTIEDIHMIMTMGKPKAKPQHMSVYYDKLMQVFWVSGNYLYHAHALYKLYTLSIKQNRNLSAGDAQNMASRLLLAALSIPVYDAQSAVLSDSYGILTDVLGTPTNENASRHARMASLLGYPAAAERGPLISELLARGVRDASHPELHDLYDLLEGEMAPLQFSERFKKILDFVESYDVLKEYTVPLRRVGIFRLLEQLGRVYDVMRLDHMIKVASFTDYAEVEETALTALKTRSLAVRFDYQNQCLRFESELFSTDGMRSQLGRLARRMALTSKKLTESALASGATASDKEVVAISLEKEKKADARRTLSIAKAKEQAEHEEKSILRRRDIIERRKEEAERRTAEAVKQKKLAAAREMALADARRKQEEAKRRFDEQKKLAKAPVESAASTSVTRSGVIGAQEVEGEAAREERMTREKEKELKEQAEFKKRTHQLAGHLNYIERALREEQWGLLKEDHVNEAERQARLTEEVAVKELESAKDNHARALEDKGRTNNIMPHLAQYMSDVMMRVDNDFETWSATERERAEAQAAKEAEIAQQRNDEEQKRVAQEEAEKAEEEATLAQEEQAKKDAEEKRLQDERDREAKEAKEAQEEQEAREALEASKQRVEKEQKAVAAKTPASSSGKYVPAKYVPPGQRKAGGGDVAAANTAPSDASHVASRERPPMGSRGPSSFGSRELGSRDVGTRERFGSFGSNESRDSREERPRSGSAYRPPRSGAGRELPSSNAARPPASSSGEGTEAPPQRKKFFNSKLQKQPTNQ